MGDLAVGDYVMTGKGHYQPVYAFGHYHKTMSAEFLQLHFVINSKKNVLEITREHLIYVGGKNHPIPARAVSVGDELVTDLAAGTSILVTKISHVQRKGVFAPLTADGSVVVNGVVASSYITLQGHSSDGAVAMGDGTRLTWLSHHAIIHHALAPFRFLCVVTGGWPAYTTNDLGMPSYVAYGLKLAHWVDEQHVWVQTIVLIASLVLYGIFLPLDFYVSMVGTSSTVCAPLVVLVGLLMVVLVTTQIFSVRVVCAQRKAKML
jgi:hypothetical protein